VRDVIRWQLAYSIVSSTSRICYKQMVITLWEPPTLI
jgi:hypothetical protein